MGLYKRKDSSYWWFKHTHKGHTIYQSTKTTKKAEAELIWTDFLDKSQSNCLIHRNKTWEDLVNLCRDSYQKNDQRFLDWTLKLWGKKKLIDLTSEDLIRLQDLRNYRVVAASCNRNFSVVRAVLRKAERELNWIPKAPYLKKMKETKFNPIILNEEQERWLLLRLPPHLQAIVEFALQTGLRKTAIVGLTYDMFDAQQGILHIPTYLNKHGEPTSINITQKARQIIADQPVKGIYRQIFKYQGRPIKDPARSAWRKARSDCGLSDFRFHDLRHTWTSRWAQKGVSEAQIAYLGGWKSARMVSHYTNLNNLNISDLPGY